MQCASSIRERIVRGFGPNIPPMAVGGPHQGHSLSFDGVHHVRSFCIQDIMAPGCLTGRNSRHGWTAWAVENSGGPCARFTEEGSRSAQSWCLLSSLFVSGSELDMIIMLDKPHINHLTNKKGTKSTTKHTNLPLIPLTCCLISSNIQENKSKSLSNQSARPPPSLPFCRTQPHLSQPLRRVVSAQRIQVRATPIGVVWSGRCLET